MRFACAVNFNLDVVTTGMPLELDTAICKREELRRERGFGHERLEHAYDGFYGFDRHRGCPPTVPTTTEREEFLELNLSNVDPWRANTRSREGQCPRWLSGIAQIEVLSRGFKRAGLAKRQRRHERRT